jgi:hypothetical protein
MFLTRSTSTTGHARVWLAPTRHKVVHLALLIQIMFLSALRVCKMFDILGPLVGAMLTCNADLQCRLAMPYPWHGRRAVLFAPPQPSR